MAPQQNTATRLDNAEVGLTEAMRDVSTKLDAPGLVNGERMRLLQRQAELGDLRDELAVRRRRMAYQTT